MVRQLLEECRCGGGRWLPQRREDVGEVLAFAVEHCYSSGEQHHPPAATTDEADTAGADWEDDHWLRLTIDYGKRCGMLSEGEEDAYVRALCQCRRMRSSTGTCGSDSAAGATASATRTANSPLQPDAADWFVSSVVLLAGPERGPHILRQLCRRDEARLFWFRFDSDKGYVALCQVVQQACEQHAPQVHTALRLAGCVLMG